MEPETLHFNTQTGDTDAARPQTTLEKEQHIPIMTNHKDSLRYFLRCGFLEGVEKKDSSYIVGRNVNWYSYYGIWRLLKNLEIELPYEPAIPLLDI